MIIPFPIKSKETKEAVCFQTACRELLDNIPLYKSPIEKLDALLRIKALAMEEIEQLVSTYSERMIDDAKAAMNEVSKEDR